MRGSEPLRGGSHEPDEQLTVGEAASLVGVSVRTLHHWDEIGLVVPSGRSGAGYRLYDAEDVARIHRVLVYRETGMPLAEVARALDDPATDAAAHLARQRGLLLKRISHLQRMVRAVDTMMETIMEHKSLNPAEQAEVWGTGWTPEYRAEAEERWGGTDDWKVSQERLAARTPAEREADQERLADVERRLAAAMAAGVRPGSQEANALAEEHRAALTWFDVTHAKHVMLARGYVGDPRFTAHYEGVAVGLAAWLKEVIDANAAAHGCDPATATWT